MSIMGQIFRISRARDSAFLSLGHKTIYDPDKETMDYLPEIIDSIPTYDGFTFNVDQNGHLIMTYTTSSPPNISISNGHLILEY